jgi:hypothetical protein
MEKENSVCPKCGHKLYRGSAITYGCSGCLAWCVENVPDFSIMEAAKKIPGSLDESFCAALRGHR